MPFYLAREKVYFLLKSLVKNLTKYGGERIWLLSKLEVEVSGCSTKVIISLDCNYGSGSRI